MKVKLEEVLLKEAKAPRSSGEFSSVEEIAEYYLNSHGFRDEIAKKVTNIKTNPANGGMSDWASITIWMGLILRAHSDGQDIMQFLGLDRNEAQQIVNATTLLRGKCSEYKKNNPSTPTAQLYAQVKQLGF